MTKARCLFVALLIGVATSVLAQDGDPAKGQTAYALCTACHQANGEGNLALNAPAIAGQQSWYLERQLKYFKEGIRGNDPKDIYGMQMKPMAMTLADDQAIKDVVAYIVQMQAVSHEATLSGGNADQGEALYALCATCHGADGKGLAALNAPNLTLLQDWYLERQLKHFREGIRGNDPKDIYGQQMKPMVMTLADDQAIKDVIAYILTLQ